MRVGAIVGEPLKVHERGSPAEQRARVYQLLDEVGLSPAAIDRYPHEFSGGQRQRIGLARALALNPKLIVADEPVSALDVSIQAQILNLMKDLQARHHLTFVLISHDLAVVRYMVDTIGVMYLGKLVELGPAHEVYEHPAHPYTRGLLDAVPEPDPIAARQKLASQPRVRGELPSAVHPPVRVPFPHPVLPCRRTLCAGGAASGQLRRRPRCCLPLPTRDADHALRIIFSGLTSAPDAVGGRTVPSVN